jgi:hypothetical protein
MAAMQQIVSRLINFMYSPFVMNCTNQYTRALFCQTGIISILQITYAWSNNFKIKNRQQRRDALVLTGTLRAASILAFPELSSTDDAA